MFILKLLVLLLTSHFGLSRITDSLLVEASQERDFNGKRFVRHLGVGGAIGGFGVFGGGFAAPVQPLPVVAAVPVITTVPVVTTIQSYPAYGGYDGYGDGYGKEFGGFGAGFGVAKFRVKGFSIGGGILG